MSHVMKMKKKTFNFLILVVINDELTGKSRSSFNPGWIQSFIAQSAAVSGFSYGFLLWPNGIWLLRDLVLFKLDSLMSNIPSHAVAGCCSVS